MSDSIDRPQAARHRLGAFRLEEQVSQGYFGERWVARRGDDENDDGSLVCLRRVAVASAPGIALKDELCSAAWFAMDIDSPHAAKVLDVVAEGDELAIVTEYSEGETLRALLQLATEDRVAIPVDVLIRVALDVLAGLSAVQEAAEEDEDGLPYVHGALSPDSVLIGVDGTASLLDLATGAVAARSSDWTFEHLALPYRAPEQLQDGGELGPDSDLFVLGIMLWECLMRERLFTGDTPGELRKCASERAIGRVDATDARSDEAVSEALADAIERMLQRDRDARFESFAQLQQVLEALPGEPASRARVSEQLKLLAGPEARAKRQRLGTTMMPPAPAPELEEDTASKASVEPQGEPQTEDDTEALVEDEDDTDALVEDEDDTEALVEGEDDSRDEVEAKQVVAGPPQSATPSPRPSAPTPPPPPTAASAGASKSSKAPARVSVAHLRAHAPPPAAGADLPPPIEFATPSLPFLDQAGPPDNANGTTGAEPEPEPEPDGSSAADVDDSQSQIAADSERPDASHARLSTPSPGATARRRVKIVAVAAAAAAVSLAIWLSADDGEPGADDAAEGSPATAAADGPAPAAAPEQVHEPEPEQEQVTETETPEPPEPEAPEPAEPESEEVEPAEPLEAAASAEAEPEPPAAEPDPKPSRPRAKRTTRRARKKARRAPKKPASFVPDDI